MQIVELFFERRQLFEDASHDVAVVSGCVGDVVERVGDLPVVEVCVGDVMGAAERVGVGT